MKKRCTRNQAEADPHQETKSWASITSHPLSCTSAHRQLATSFASFQTAKPSIILSSREWRPTSSRGHTPKNTNERYGPFLARQSASTTCQNERTNERNPGQTEVQGPQPNTNETKRNDKPRETPEGADPLCPKASKLRGHPKVQTLNARWPFFKARATAKQASASKTVEPRIVLLTSLFIPFFFLFFSQRSSLTQHFTYLHSGV